MEVQHILKISSKKIYYKNRGCLYIFSEQKMIVFFLIAEVKRFGELKTI